MSREGHSPGDFTILRVTQDCRLEALCSVFFAAIVMDLGEHLFLCLCRLVGRQIGAGPALI